MAGKILQRDIPDIEKTEKLARIFEVLGSKVRLKMLQMIAEEEKCVNFLSERMKLSQPTVSYHLKLLFNMGLVSQHKRAQWIQYKLNKERLRELIMDFSRIYGILTGKGKVFL